MKSLLFLLLMVTTITTIAQENIDGKDEAAAKGKNLVKINLPALAFKNITLQYERQVADKITLAGTFRLMPKGSIPFKRSIIKLADDEETERQLNNLEVGNVAVMPEIRFYLGKKGAFHGFYMAPFASIAKYDASLLFEYDDNGETKTIPLSGSVNSITGGLMLGAQWNLGNAVYLDWWILGPNYGGSKGDITGRQNLTPSEQQSIRDELNHLDVPLTDFTYNVNADGATINFKGPWAGVRAGICIGIRF